MLTNSKRSVWIITLTCCTICIVPVQSTALTKCLGRPEVTPKRYPHYMEQAAEIVVETSNRIIHRISTEIFKIFLEEILGFDRVKIVQRDDAFEILKVIDSLSPQVGENVSLPDSMINLEVWLPPDFDTIKMDVHQFVKECGSSLPPGRFGWFIPKRFDRPIRQYYKKWLDNTNEVHWSILRDRELMAQFAITGGTSMDEITRLSYKPGGKEHFCNESSCSNGMYVPPQCRDANVQCGLMLTDHYNYTNFVIEHINELKAYVKVMWLGDNLRKGVRYLEAHINSKEKSFLILHWTPSHVILRESDYISVIFPHCNVHNATSSSLGCKYELARLVKFSWNKLEGLDRILFQAMCSFRIDEDSLLDLLNLYEKDVSGDPGKIACSWMKMNSFTWENWKTDTDTTTIYIGGIFPVTGSSYHGAGIVRGALMAKEAINKNKFLHNYNLQLLVSNGQCRPDSVMKAFIDYIIDGYYNNLIGVLGPACSDTVEPLAGVSKHYRIMVVSYSAEGASFSDRHKYPYFFRTIGENKFYKHVYLQLFKRLGWKRVAALTEDGQKYTEYISFMQELLESNGITFIANIKFSREASTMRKRLEELKKKEARIIILDVFDEIARQVMCDASKLKMTSADGYVWFLPTWLNQTWYDTDYFNKFKKESVSCTTSDMIKAVTGYFSMAHAYWAADDAMIPENITVRQWRQNYEKLSKSMIHPVTSNYAGYAYDAVWVYALALRKLIDTDPESVSDIHSENTTNKLLQLIKDTDFNGVSGRIKFRGGPSRFSVINVMEWYANKSQIVGQFFPNLTDDKPEILGGTLELNVSALQWFTPDRAIPQDGSVAPTVCALESLAQTFNVDCEMALVILNIGILFIVICTLGCIVYVIKRRYEKKVEFTQSYMRKWGIDFMLKPVNNCDLDKWEIPRSSVVINRKLGEGAFGTVYGGEADLADDVTHVKKWVAVAVKTLKIGSSTEEKLDFLSEAEVMKRFEHKNIVKLLGVCTTEEPVYTVMEYMLYGDLKTYLLARRHLVNHKNVEESDEISSKKLTAMALDVARGLSYLAELKYVHRDLASRNCLINDKRVVKLGDFGMTRPMFENDYYRFTRRGMLPVRWMSPESLALGLFTPASDVWSYGVLLYEIITFGSFPYQGMTNLDVLEHVKKGNILTIPETVKGPLRTLMMSCWCQDAKQRTRASEIVEILANSPRLLHPCLDVPLASVQLDDSQDMEISLPDQFRKFSSNIGKTSPISTARNGTATILVETTCDGATSSHDVGSHSSKEPLLGKSKSKSSLLDFGKFPKSHSSDDDDDVDDVPKV